MLINIVTVDETKLVSQIININRFITYQPIIGWDREWIFGPWCLPPLLLALANYKNQNSERAA